MSAERFTFDQLKNLQQLFHPPRENSDSDSDDENLKQKLSRKKIGSVEKTAPGNESSAEAAATNSSDEKKVQAKESDIWHPAEVESIASFQKEDPRVVPEYKMKFKQSVGTEDIYLGMNLKTPGTASCEWLTLTVKLPEEIRERVELSVESNVVDLRSPKYRLQLPTPFPVDPNGSSAKWHADNECLEITLKLSRELDDVNF
ncbi:hypothetical protein TKK_0003549 [Trichogramma kaykai]|uniref:PIH1D1/2/3 CS-like domain-containing protein n=1 Tax=Trichogramma kaykai TaxID=54128 RepID=A0ABD2XQD9_9HYME